MKYIKYKYIVIIIVAIFGISGCASLKTSGIFKPEKDITEESLFDKAEKLFVAKSFNNALEYFNDYIVRFPSGKNTPVVLMHSGLIYKEKKEYPKARDLFKKLVENFPDNFYVPDAISAIVETLYSEKKYKEMLGSAGGFLEHTTSWVHLEKIYLLLSDAGNALNHNSDAAYYCINAYAVSNEPDKEKILNKLQDIIEKLDSQKIVILHKSFKNDRMRGYFLYLLGLLEFRKNSFLKSLQILSEFVSRYPEHEKNSSAVNILEQLYKKSEYRRFTIGCLLPLSGRYKFYGNKALRAIELALNRFSFDPQAPVIELIIKDTGSNGAKSSKAVQELSEKNIAAIIGPIITSEHAAKTAQEKQIPIITMTQKDDITLIGDYVFRNFLTPEMQTKSLVSYVMEYSDIKKFAILYPDEKYGEKFMNLFWDEVLFYGGEVVAVESYDPRQTDFVDSIKKIVGIYYDVPEDLKNKEACELNIDDFLDDMIKKIPDLYYVPPETVVDLDDIIDGDEQDNKIEKNNNIDKDKESVIDFDAVFIPDAPDKVGLIIPQLAYYDINEVCLLGTNLWHSDNLIKMAGRYMKNAILIDGFFADKASINVKEFVRDFEKIFDEKPGFIEAIAYDTANILFEIIRRPEIRFKSAIKDALKKVSNYDGVTGLTTFDNTGEVSKDLNILRIKGDKFVELIRPQ